MRTMRHLSFKDERGISLLVALGVLFALSLTGAAAIKFSSANARGAEVSMDRGSAHALAEAGIARGLSVLNGSAAPLDPGALPTTTVSEGAGTVTFDGQLVDGVWTISATGSVSNPTGAADLTQTVTAIAEVRGIVPGAQPAYWNRLYHDNSGRCLTVEDLNIPVSIAAAGDLCLRGNARITGATTTLEVGGDLTLEEPSRVGALGQQIAEAHVAGTCAWFKKPAHSMCGPGDKVNAMTVTSSPPNLTRPTIDLPYWYEHAKPGPMHGCDIGSFPHGFDNDSTYNNSRPGGRKTDAYGRRIAEVTPTDLSYTCQALDGAGNIVGEISWNHVTHVMTISGSVFVDGDVRFDDDGQLVNYQGRGIIFAAGDIEYDEVVCAGGDGTKNCFAGDMTDWAPETNMMIILSGADSEYDQGKTWPRQPAALQGVMYAQDDCTIHQHFKMSGPVICDEILFPFDETWPEVYPWPPLGSLIDAQIYGDPGGATEYAVELLGIYG